MVSFPGAGQLASNAPFSEWGQTFADPRLAAAVVDRLTFHAHIIETGSESYRLRLTRGGATASPRQSAGGVVKDTSLARPGLPSATGLSWTW